MVALVRNAPHYSNKINDLCFDGGFWWMCRPGVTFEILKIATGLESHQHPPNHQPSINVFMLYGQRFLSQR
jgi:hypothetical protein